MNTCSSQESSDAIPLPKSPAAATSSNGLGGSPATSGSAEAKPRRRGSDLPERALDEADLHRVGGEHRGARWPKSLGRARLGPGKRGRPAEGIAELAGATRYRARARATSSPSSSCDPRLEQRHPPPGRSTSVRTESGASGHRAHELAGEPGQLQPGAPRSGRRTRARTAPRGRRRAAPRDPRGHGRLRGHKALAVAYKERIRTHRRQTVAARVHSNRR